MSLFNDSSKELSHKSHFSHESDYTAHAVGLFLCAACEVRSILRHVLPLFCNTLPFLSHHIQFRLTFTTRVKYDFFFLPLLQRSRMWLAWVNVGGCVNVLIYLIS